MPWLFAALGGAAVVLAIAFRTVGALKAEKAALGADLQAGLTLTRAVAGHDWQRSAESLTGALVETATGQAAALLSVSDRGELELQASACGGGERWEPAIDAAARQAQESCASCHSSDGTLWLPVTDDGDLAGLLAIKQARTAHRNTLQIAVQMAGLCLTGIRLYQKHSLLSNTDGLTGLVNHRHFQQALGVAIGRAYLEGEPLALILLDIDHFKVVNDTYGHLLGDLVLREIASVLREQLPPAALAARYGGEEMAVILRGPLAQRAGEIAETLRAAVAAHQILDFTSGAKLSVTVSLGVAGYELGQGKGRLIARADEAMYASKRAGRNRVTIAPRENITSHLFPS